MKFRVKSRFGLLVTLLLNFLQVKCGSLDEEAQQYLNDLESRYSQACNRQMTKRWEYMTNVTDKNEKESTEAGKEYLKFKAEIQKEIFEKFKNWRDIKNETVKREFKYLSILGPGTMPEANVAKMTDLVAEMESAYVTATVCEFGNSKNCSLKLPELELIFETERDPQKLAYYWTEWHNKMSQKVPPEKYQEFLSFQLEMAKANGFKDMSEMLMIYYDDESADFTGYKFQKDMLDIWEDLRPMYEKVHAYVRMKLRRLPEYKDLIKKCGYLPAYALGNMWAQEWINIDGLTKPYPNAPSLDATQAMLKKNYTVLKIFQEADKFYTGLGLYPMTDTFWSKSSFEKPAGREVICHPSAEDFCLGKNSEDFRINQCTKVTMSDLVVVHHEMGHIQYFHQYTNLPFIFREGANPGFHEAIGDALALAVVTPKHLQCKLKLDLGFNSSLCEDSSLKEDSVSETDINYLYITALQTLVFFPFAISMDSWRWEAFQGKIGPAQFNSRWWELRKTNQGVEPPTDRSSSSFFDPAGKYHIVMNVEYLRYFVSQILQFQFYEAMCIAAGEYNPSEKTKPLYQCDFSGSKEAGRVLGNMLKLGASKGWPIALETLTGSRKMSTSSFKNYLKPLLDYIDKELEANGEIAGFGASCEEVKQKRAQGK